MRQTVTVIAVVTLLLVACGGNGGDGGAPDTTTGNTGAGTGEPDGGFDGSWVLLQGETDGAPLDPPATHRITLLVDGSSVGGQAACNGYGGTMNVDGGRVSISDLYWTEMACEPFSVMEIEQAYLNALPAVDTAVVTNGEMELRGDSVNLTFERLEEIDDESLVDTLWTLDTLIEGDSASSVSGEPATLLLTSDGAIEGSTGCRTVVGEYEIVGDEVLATELSAIGRCRSRLRPQDGHVLEVLGDGFTITVEGDHLTVTSQGGAGLRYTAH